MLVVWEIIRFYSYIDSKTKEGKIDIDDLVEYVRTFTCYVKLNKYYCKFMSYLYLVQLLASKFGYKQYITYNSKTNLLDFALFKQNCVNSYFKAVKK